MRKISTQKIKNTVSELCVKANFELRDDIRKALKKALKKETKKRSKRFLAVLVENSEIAKKERRALCQDTGLVSVYIRIGRQARIVGGDLRKAVNRGVAEAYRKNFLRKSVVKSPLIRENTATNTPAVIYSEITEGDRIKVTVMPKGFGSENRSRGKMLNPTDGEKEIISFVLETVKEAGPDACPPYILGIGLGGTFDKVASLAKEALILPLDRPNPKKYLGRIETLILKKANKLGIGPMGLGGKTTCLGVRILEHPTHIAGLPVAVNIGCHVTRSATAVIS